MQKKSKEKREGLMGLLADSYKEKDDLIEEINKFKKKVYNSDGFDMHGTHKDTCFTIDSNGFRMDGTHKHTKKIYNPYGFNIHGIHKDTNDEYDSNDFNIYMALTKIQVIQEIKIIYLEKVINLVG